MLKELMETVFAEGSGSVEADRFLDAYEEIRKKHEAKPGVFSHLPKSVAEIEKKRFFERILPNFIMDEVLRIEKDEHAPRFFEKEVEFRIADAVIRGKVDRVDVRKRNVAVIDYKIGRVRDRKYFDFENLQLPLLPESAVRGGLCSLLGPLSFNQQACGQQLFAQGLFF